MLQTLHQFTEFKFSDKQPEYMLVFKEKMFMLAYQERIQYRKVVSVGTSTVSSLFSCCQKLREFSIVFPWCNTQNILLACLWEDSILCPNNQKGSQLFRDKCIN